MKNNAYIQIGDKPGWKKPVLNIFINGDTMSVPITQKMKKMLLATKNIAKEG
jgi:hypothetical protein